MKKDHAVTISSEFMYVYKVAAVCSEFMLLRCCARLQFAVRGI